MRILIAGVLALIAGYASGQTDGHPAIAAVQLTGSVVDVTGAVVPDAPVRLRLAGHGAARRQLLAGKAACPTTLTSAYPGATVLAIASRDGTFSFPVEPLQTYELSVDSDGFAPLVKTIFVGGVPEVKAGDMVLSIGRGSGPAVETGAFVRGLGQTRGWLSTSDFAGLPQKTVKTSEGGTPVTFRGVLLADALSEAGTPSGEVQIVKGPGGAECRSTAPLYQVLVSGKGGHNAVFAWTEVDPSIARNPVYLVTERDGKPLADGDGPLQIVAPGDKSAARWVRQVISLWIRRGDQDNSPPLVVPSDQTPSR